MGVIVNQWHINGCGHCGGDVRTEEDSGGWRKVCVQCGREGHVPLTEDEEEQVVKRRKVKYGRPLRDSS